MSSATKNDGQSVTDRVFNPGGEQRDLSKDSERKPRIGVYVESEPEPHILNLLKALKYVTSPRGDGHEPYDIYLYSSSKIWKKYCKDFGHVYRPFPTSGASNKLGKMMFGKHVDSPKPEAWVGEMLKRKASDVHLELMIFAAPTSLVAQMDLPTIVILQDLEKRLGTSAYDKAWYDDLYKTVLENAGAILVDPSEGVEYLSDVTAVSPTDITLISLDLDRQMLGEDLTYIIRGMLAPGKIFEPKPEPAVEETAVEEVAAVPLEADEELPAEEQDQTSDQIATGDSPEECEVDVMLDSSEGKAPKI
ncbi:MAG: hypothetical protein FWE46_00640 [Coriobacteriia bacterium]|nr:hypothetical protein [Coriobacteriia bacterium]MCL2536718.1 hypothetical protein [Coriobacteriia bacterium]